MSDDAVDRDSEPAAAANASAISTAQTIIPRHLAASFDFVMMFILIVFCAKTIGDKHPIWQAVAIVASALGYFLLFEGLLGRTPGKLLAGLKVIGIDGRPSTWRQAFIRTAFRILEVNPILLGELPAALCIVFSRRNQRLGDKVAKTIVVPARRIGSA